MQFLPFAACTLGLGSLAIAQCTSVWVPTTTGPGANGTVHASTMWDPDGGGPQRPRLVLGGSFTSSSGSAMANVVAIDPDTGLPSALASGLSGTVRALTTMSNGDLVAGGDFYFAGSTYVSSLARWNGSSWQSVGGGVASIPIQSVQALAALPNGELVVGGVFTWAGSTTAFYIARWDGTQWHALGSGMNSWVGALAVLPNGDLVAGGQFTVAGGTAANRVARWDGTQWNALGAGFDSYVTSLAVAPNGDVIAGGWFTQAGGAPANRIARWNGTTWQALGSGCNASVHCLLVQANGDVVVGGSFTQAGGISCARVARYAGIAWQALGSGFDADARTLTLLPDGDLVAAGELTTSGQASLPHVARWRANTWQWLAGQPALANVVASTLLPDGRVVAATNTSVLRLDGSTWTTLGTFTGPLSCIATSATGQIAVGGFSGTAVWTAGVWQNLPNLGTIYGVAWAPNNDLFATTSIAVQRWNGAVWSAVGQALSNPRQIVVRANGRVVVACTNYVSITTANPFLAEFDGTTWNNQAALGSAYFAQVRDLLLLPNDDVVVCGYLLFVARWDGSNLQVLGYSNDARSLAALPDGSFVASATDAPTSRWDGSTWLPLGAESNHTEMLGLPNGEILALGSQVRFTSTCLASARSLTTGCVGPAGVLQLTANTLPWLGTTLAHTATGFAPGSLALSVFGFSGIDLPLVTILPQALPECHLLASPDAITLVGPSAGTATSQLVIPTTSSLRGTALFHQFVQLELGGPSGIQTVSTSNGRALTIGGY